MAKPVEQAVPRRRQSVSAIIPNLSAWITTAVQDSLGIQRKDAKTQRRKAEAPDREVGRRAAGTCQKAMLQADLKVLQDPCRAVSKLRCRLRRFLEYRIHPRGAMDAERQLSAEISARQLSKLFAGCEESAEAAARGRSPPAASPLAMGRRVQPGIPLHAERLRPGTGRAPLRLRFRRAAFFVPLRSNQRLRNRRGTKSAEAGSRGHPAASIASQRFFPARDLVAASPRCAFASLRLCVKSLLCCR